MSKILKDPAGTLLKYFFLSKDKGSVKERANWEKENLNNTPAHHWNSSVDLNSLRYYLEVGRDKNQFWKQFNRVVRNLINKDLIEKDPEDDNPDTVHYIITPIGEYAFKNNCYLEILNGFRYICDKSKNSVAKIYSSTQSGIGTGFLIAENKLATAKHVVDDLKNIKIEFEDNREVTIKNIIRPTILDDLDIALIEINESLTDRKIFRLQNDRDILEEVLILGYPPIPQSDDAYLVANRGEISSIISLYRNQIQGIVVSSLLRGGNSGGPIINFRGETIGVISENLFQEMSSDDPTVNEKLAFAYGIGSEFVQDLINSNV